jgi:hypothetical protein
MMRREAVFANVALRCSKLALVAFLLCTALPLRGQPGTQADSDVAPDTTPQIQQINPNQAAAGTHVTVVIQGSGFSAGAYVSSVSPAVHVESSKRISATQLEAQVSLSPTAQPATVSLLVSNPASRAAEAAFKILAQDAAPASPPPGTVTPTPSQPGAPSSPAVPSVPAAPPAPGAPAAPSTPAVLPTPATPPVPEVTSIDPPQVGRGFDMDVIISGKNFAQGTKVSFANPGIRVMGIGYPSPNRLSVHIRVAPDAPTGSGSLYVFNPDDSEAEVPFIVTLKNAPIAAPSPSPAAVPSPTNSPTAATVQRYEAYHLGSPAEVMEMHGKLKGALVVSSGSILYQEAGKTLINIALNDIREIKTSSVATATFHITLMSGKTFHFAPGSLRPSDARDLVDALRNNLPH